MSYFAIQIHYYNGDDDGALCVGLCSLNVWNGVISTLVLDEQRVRMFALLHVYLNLKVLDNYQCSMQYDAVSYIHSILLPK